ncbi:hypothetical protein HPC49_11875 [Pyxidicoccus fallax]|uniref:Alginate export domain-containing protein n=1 Tax=Pyxidicoccus fallax TaxID=394095 RepID=A0A848LH95_9BACT|nr:hypothetical protein [Pyxidicoccus fallax]NMO17343.1 hypothetical protein [Pyxidicoccus fallax]NPC78938.1 hypothetical protein [Pyxidicoccus fallax]
MAWWWLSETCRTARRAAGLVALALAGASLPAAAQSTPVPGLYYGEWYEEKNRDEDAKPREFILINYFFTRLSLTNEVGDPAGLRGVSLGPIGALAGSAVRVEPSQSAYFVEQRWIPVIEYSPHFVDGLASFRAQFEVDFLWGRSANAVQQNEGGGFNADQVNIQTKNVNVAIYPTRKPSQLTLLIGTQPVYDSLYDPTRTPLADITRTGYKLAFLGSDATGLSIFSSYKGHARLSLLPLGTAQADKATRGDPRLKYIWLAMADYTYPVRPNTNVGVSAWALNDATKGDAYAFDGLVKSGPSSTGLNSFTGTARFPIERPEGTVFWVGANFNHNIDFRMGRLGASGFVMYNGGEYTSDDPERSALDTLTISGLSANLELMYQWGRGPADVVTLEGMFTTGDNNLADDRYTGAFTLNQYGLPGAVWFNHKMLILFPFTSTVNNYTGAVTDISNQGYGLRAGIASAAWDIVPNKLNLKLATGIANSGATPARWSPDVRRGRFIGAEVNAELRYHIRYLMTAGLHAGYMFRGSFYDGSTTVRSDPFAVFSTFTWYAF